MSAEITPRVTSGLRENFKNQTVRIVGKLEQLLSSSEGKFGESDGQFVATLASLEVSTPDFQWICDDSDFDLDNRVESGNCL